jgi:hypothetical protein
MAHFAKIVDGIVENVIVAASEEWCEENLGGTWVQTSYNTHANQHTQGGEPLNKNYAGIGFTWDGTGFAAPQPFDSWILNEETYIWEAPTPMPEDENIYIWDEESLSWQLVTID